VTRLDGGDVVADLQHGPDALVAENRPGLHFGHVALEDVQVGAADRRRVDPDDDVGRRLEFGIGPFLPAPLVGPVVDERLHRGSFLWTHAERMRSPPATDPWNAARTRAETTRWTGLALCRSRDKGRPAWRASPWWSCSLSRSVSSRARPRCCALA